MTGQAPVLIFAAGALAVTVALAWCVRAFVLIGRAAADWRTR